MSGCWICCSRSRPIAAAASGAPAGGDRPRHRSALFVVPAAGSRAEGDIPDAAAERHQRTREKLRQLLETGSSTSARWKSRSRSPTRRMIEMLAPQGAPEGMGNFGEMLQEMMPKRTSKRTVKVTEARRILMDQELEKLIDAEDVTTDALERVEKMGIIFLDEIDKIAGERAATGGPDVSREGVQRDLLPIVEGSNVQTKYGMVKTDHVLFIAAGAFHVVEAERPDPGAAGPIPDPRGAQAAHRAATSCGS